MSLFFFEHEHGNGSDQVEGRNEYDKGEYAEHGPFFGLHDLVEHRVQLVPILHDVVISEQAAPRFGQIFHIPVRGTAKFQGRNHGGILLQHAPHEGNWHQYVFTVEIGLNGKDPDREQSR